MRTLSQTDLKGNYLRQSATLNPHPEQVSARLFQTDPFFDPRDLVQVKYEMLRQVIRDGQPMGSAAAAFGFSRVRWYQLRQRFTVEGLVGLLPQSKGPRQASKVSAEILSYILQTLQAEPGLRITETPMRVVQQFGVFVHLRSIERALARGRKKAFPKRAHWMRPLRRLSGVGPNAWSAMKPCAARHWSPGVVPARMV
jgi:transposase